MEIIDSLQMYINAGWYVLSMVVILHWLFDDYDRVSRFWSVVIIPFDLLLWVIAPGYWRKIHNRDWDV